jgi:hypothetical protein
MSQYMTRDLTWHTLADTVTYSLTQRMEQIRKAPHYLREMLVFPYIKGQLFCAAVYARGGFSALSAVYANPPASTAQILHPEKYFAETREDPIPVEFPNTTFDGNKPLYNNVLGEMGSRLLFTQYADADTADSDAAGWRGDRYLVYDDGNTLVWKTVWSSPGAARAAAADIAAMCLRRFNLVTTDSGNFSTTNVNQGHCARIQFDAGNGFTFILAADEKILQRLTDQFVRFSHG